MADNTENYHLRLTTGDVSNSNDYITWGEIKVEEVDNTTLANNVYRLGDVSWTKSGAAYPTITPEVTASQIKKIQRFTTSKANKFKPYLCQGLVKHL